MRYEHSRVFLVQSQSVYFEAWCLDLSRNESHKSNKLRLWTACRLLLVKLSCNFTVELGTNSSDLVRAAIVYAVKLQWALKYIQ